MSKKAMALQLLGSKKDTRKTKKQIDENIISRFAAESEEEKEKITSKRKLRKICDINQSEEFVPDNEENDMMSEGTEKMSEDEDYSGKFQIKDDEDIQKQIEKNKSKIENKNLKGNQQIDKFIKNKEIQAEKADPKKIGSKTAKNEKKVQLTIQDMNRIKKEKKLKRKNSSDFIVSDDQDENDGDYENDIEKQKQKAYNYVYEKFNGSGEDDQDKLIKKAMMLSLTATSLVKKKAFNQISEDQQIQIAKAHKKEVLSKKKQEEEHLKKSKKVEAKKQKQTKTGPLAGLVIALTGEFQPFSKLELIEVIQKLGGQCPKSITKKCTILIQGSYVLDHFKRRVAQTAAKTSKSEEAIAKGIYIVSNDQIDQFFKEKTGKTLDQHLYGNRKQTILSDFSIKPISSAQKEKQNLKTQSTKLFQKQEKMDIEIILPKNKENQSLKKKNEKVDWSVLWTEKYKPRCLNEIIGQSTQIKSLREWIEAWEDIQINGNKRQIKFQKRFLPQGSINSAAALLSGEPGLGKTTTARLLAEQYGYTVVEFNASDIRNKSGVKLLQSDSYVFGHYRTDKQDCLTKQKTLILMDEVDGMSSGDRGGIAEIIGMIKKTKVPIICICNDREGQKIRSLAGNCYDIRFHKPNKTSIAKRLRQIIYKEGGTSQDIILEKIVETYQNDMRQILSYLQIVFKTKTKDITSAIMGDCNSHSKDGAVMINHTDAAVTLMNKTTFKSVIKPMTIRDRLDCFFVDSDLVPLLIHEHYLSSSTKTKLNTHEYSKFFHRVVQATEGFVLGDLLDKNIRKQQEWGLMPSYGFMSCIYTTEKVSQSIGFASFPSWLGKFSSERKNRRLIKELKNKIAVTASCSTRSVKNDYAPALLNEIVQMMKQENVESTLQFMDEYRLSPLEMNQHLLCLQYNPTKKNLLDGISTKAKSNLTRMYNKRQTKIQGKNVKGEKKAKPQKDHHLKYNSVLEEVEDGYSEEDFEQPENKEDSKEQPIVANIKQIKGKPKKK